MIQSQQVQYGRVKIVHIHPILYSPEAKFIGRPKYHPSLNATSCHPYGKTVGVMVAAIA